ncbi:DUF5992 family protein [Microbulbifer sp. 2205BS26-8]|uniref:DUF5992 family protein n=1 Tax=Microbulbifer sp. 2205BS26-8 TaxID=3064386 RepID=UPI00273D780A|nr:DUF5992 family protein [Microbulbifer sp. 2205BS26-8]MDP5210106.1 DUF5992 family protein [Microbulbifer sp. 2205BS26-8]
MMKRKLLLLVCTLFSMKALASSGYIALEVEITSVANTGANAKSFTVKTANGSGLCSGETITFPLALSGNDGHNEGIHNRAYSAALMALSTGKLVSIFSYDDASFCNRAAYIEVFK